MHLQKKVRRYIDNYKNIVELETIATILVNTVVLHIAVHSVTKNIEYLTKLL